MRDLNLELDLSFHSAPANSLKSFKDPLIHLLLTKVEPWQEILLNWLCIIRNDSTLICPEVVRSSSCISMGLQFTDDRTITKLNSIWRNKEEHTDVLSFPIIDNSTPLQLDNSVELGDIVVSVTTAKRQALEMNHGLEIELRWLVSHGLLHLLGWDHPDQPSLNKMLSFQKDLIQG